MTGLCNGFEGGEHGYFVLGPRKSSWLDGIFRARGCEGAASAIPSRFTLWEMVPVGGFLTLWPFENLYLWGTVLTPLSRVQLGLRVDDRAHGHLSGFMWVNTRIGHRPEMSGFLAVVTCNNQLSSLQCLGMSQGMAETATWFPVVRKNETILLHYGRSSWCVDSSCAVPFAHTATEKPSPN